LRKPRSKPAYLESSRTIALGPLAAVAATILAAGGIWLADPFHWHTPAPASADPLAIATSAADKASGAEAETAAMGLFEDTPEARADWSSIDRDSPEELRDYASDYPRSSSAETARSLLRVLDAQAWVAAVTADNESAYAKYLKAFPASGNSPGAMSVMAAERLSSLGVERTQAIEDIQRGLAALDLYDGAIDGKAGAGTNSAVRAFASSKKRPAPSLSSAAPRDLRSFADLIARTVGGDSGLPSASAPIIAAATTPAPSNTAAAAADRQRIAEAQAAAAEAEREGADSIALAELQRTADVAAWSEAQRAGTLAAYQRYLSVYPSGAQVVAARAAVSRLSRPAAFSLDQLSTSVRVTVEAARRAQSLANTRAASAKQMAEAAQTAPNLRNITSANGDRYEAQIANSAPNGLGIRISGSGGSAGDRYRGEMRNGQTSGLGVYEFADNPNNARANALRYEGEHSGDATSGFGVTYWKNGDSFAGQQVGTPGSARGVLTFSDGQRYDGEVRNGTRHGLGVVWSADGQVLMAGRWENGLLAEPAVTEGPISLAPASQ
jgi:peptidoglycan hydrolase-like protein with peptidoglycan-binding domain